MNWVTSYNSEEPQPAYRGVMIAVGMFLTAICQTMFLHQYFQRCFMTGMRLRAALVTSIYQKTLVLSNASRQKSTVGEVILFVYYLTSDFVVNQKKKFFFCDRS